LFIIYYYITFVAIWFYFLTRRFGARKIQIAGGITFITGIMITAFTTSAWHALLSTGILSSKESNAMSQSHNAVCYRPDERANHTMPHVTNADGEGKSHVLHEKEISDNI